MAANPWITSSGALIQIIFLIAKYQVEGSKNTWVHNKVASTTLPLFIKEYNCQILLSKGDLNFLRGTHHFAYSLLCPFPLFTEYPDPAWTDELFFWGNFLFHVWRTVPKVPLYIYYRISILELHFGEYSQSSSMWSHVNRDIREFLVLKMSYIQLYDRLWNVKMKISLVEIISH